MPLDSRAFPAAIAVAVRAAGPAEPDAARQRASRTVALQCAATSIPYPERTVQSPGQSTGPPGPTSYTPLRNVSTESARVWWEAAIPGRTRTCPERQGTAAEGVFRAVEPRSAPAPAARQ